MRQWWWRVVLPVLVLGLALTVRCWVERMNAEEAGEGRPAEEFKRYFRENEQGRLEEVVPDEGPASRPAQRK